MRIRLLHDVDFFAATTPWNALLEESHARAFFLRHEVLAEWWRAFGAERLLLVLEGSEGGRVVGYAPLCVSREAGHGVLPVREVAFLGREALTGDYLDFIAAPGYEAGFADAALAWLLAHRDRWDLLRISDVRADSPTPALLRAAAGAQGLEILPGKEQVCPYLPLGKTWEEHLATRCSANMRSNLRRREKKLAAAGAVFTEVHGAAIAPALDAMFALHGARWQTRGRRGNFVDPRTRALHHALAPRLDREGRLGFWTLSMDGRVVAAIYGFVDGSTYHYFQAGFDPAFAEQGVGMALMGHAIRECIAKGLSEFDYLRGDEEYKRRWTDRTRCTVSLVVPRPGAKALAWKAIGAAKNRVKRWVRRPAPVPAPAA